MIPPSNCPYKDLSAAPCWHCPEYEADIDECRLKATLGYTLFDSNANVFSASSYEERLKRNEQDRAVLMNLSKEALVDLILPKISPL